MYVIWLDNCVKGKNRDFGYMQWEGDRDFNVGPIESAHKFQTKEAAQKVLALYWVPLGYSGEVKEDIPF